MVSQVLKQEEFIQNLFGYNFVYNYYKEQPCSCKLVLVLVTVLVNSFR